jgi:hypothetical protein
MKRALIVIFASVFLVLSAWFILRFVVGGSEDDWICVQGQWVKHGVPSAPMPTGGCNE